MPRMELKFWKPQGGTSWSASFSTLAHAILVVAWIAATAPNDEPVEETALGRVLYLPPPNPEPVQGGSAEAIQYVDVAPEGFGVGTGVEEAGVELAVHAVSPSESVGKGGRDSITASERAGSDATDSVFTVIEVDTAAARLPESAAPSYPPDLLAKRVQGQAIVQFVVDTSGQADVHSFSVVLASHPDFAAAVRAALPGMKFASARIGTTKVRQLVELPFSFAIKDPPPDSLESKAAPRRSRRP